MNRGKFTLLLAVVLALTSMSCQGKPPFASVEGTVTRAGKPLANVIVDFYPDSGTRGPRSTSEPTDEEGHYRLRSSGGSEDGAVVGTHRVCIVEVRAEERGTFGKWSEKTGFINEKKQKTARVKKEPEESRRVPRGYDSPSTTPLRLEVQPGQQFIELEITNTDVQIKINGIEIK